MDTREKKNETEVAAEAEVETEVRTEKLICDTTNPTPDDLGSVQVVATKDGEVAKIFYNFGSDLETMTTLFGPEVVFSYAKGQMVIRLQAAMRSRMSANADVAGLETEFKPGIALPKTPKDMSKATENYFMTLSPEEQNAMIEKLMGKKGS